MRLDPRQVAILAALVVVLCWVLWERCGIRGCPDVAMLASYQPGGASVLVDRNGEKFADLSPAENEVVPLGSLPAYVPAAFVAIEDKRFYEHRGVDWRRVFGALAADIRAGSFRQGSSTITMQLARNLFPERVPAREKSLRRKLLEVRLARDIEKRFTKREILELYINHIYFGGGAYGVQAASRYYFGKPAARLKLHEAALLAALPKAPNDYDPRRHPEAARARRDLALRLMAQESFISFAAADEARALRLGVTRAAERITNGAAFAGYFAHLVRNLLEQRLGEQIYARPLRIVTTLDVRAQRAAEEALTAQLRRIEGGALGSYRGSRYSGTREMRGETPAYLQGAVVLMDARSGDILAWVGGRDFGHSRFDRALRGTRQIGSAFKPFVYGAALDEGFATSQPILDEPFRVASGGGRVWEPRNFSGTYEGRMSMREALIRSQNIPAVRLAAAVGERNAAEFAHRAGVRGEIPNSPVLALGTTAVSPLEITIAYSAFATLGTRVDPRFVLRVETRDGEPIWSSTPRRGAAVRPAVAYILTDMLRDVVDYGTGTGVRGAGYRGPAAGKTGTTNSATDAWFVGYTPDVVGTVWIGFDAVRPLPGRVTGGSAAAPVWGSIMRRVARFRPQHGWGEAPGGVIALPVDPESGRVLEDGCAPRWGEVRRELFVDGSQPTSICPQGMHGGDLLGTIAGWLEDVFDLGDDPAEEEASLPTDPALGVPRLPRESGGAR